MANGGKMSMAESQKDIDVVRKHASDVTNPNNSHEPENPPNTVSQTVKRSKMHIGLKLLGEQWFLITLAILIAFASQVQVSLSKQKLKQTIVSYLCISMIFFA